MQADTAPLAAAAIYLFAGFGVLAATGMVRPSLPGALGAAGLAYLCGIAAVLLPGLALISAGVPLGVVGIVAISLAVGAGGFSFALLRRPRGRAGDEVDHAGARTGGPGIRRWGAERWVAGALVAAVAVYMAIGYAAAVLEPLTGWDAMSIWARKALLLLEFGRPTDEFFSSRYYGFMNPDYPLLLPLYESTYFRLAGGTDFQVLHGQFWILFAAFLWALGFLASRIARPLAWAPLVAVVAVAPALADDVRTMYADVPMAVFLGIGALLVGLWLAEGRGRHLVLAALLLGAAANTKNEGLAAALGILLAACLVSALAEREAPFGRRIAAPLAALAAVGAAVAPWRLWVAAHDVPTVTIPVSKGFDPFYLADHADRIEPAVSAIGTEVSDPARWYLLLPLAIAIALVVLRAPGERRLVAYYGCAGAVVFVSIVIWGYVINTIPIEGLVEDTVSRTVDGLMAVAIAALVHLSARALPRSQTG